MRFLPRMITRCSCSPRPLQRLRPRHSPIHSSPETLRTYTRLTALCIALILTGCIVGIVVPAGSGWDFANFYDTGRRAAAGHIQDIYHPDRLIKGEAPQGSMAFWGAPVSAWLYAPLSYVPPHWALVLFKIQNTLACYAALWLLYIHNRQFVDPTPVAQAKFAALFAFLSLLYQPLWTMYRVGG